MLGVVISASVVLYAIIFEVFEVFNEISMTETHTIVVNTKVNMCFTSLAIIADEYCYVSILFIDFRCKYNSLLIGQYVGAQS